MFNGMDGGSMMWLGWLFWLVLIVVIVWVVIALLSRTRGQGNYSNETALDILKKRYANGEITKEQFEEMKKHIS